ncbi:MAG TPA: DUF5667 domain-containing protein [Anaerolineales bacterium]|nr:DUF5667 domain-containing protein [Anaerolineales bacterium]
MSKKEIRTLAEWLDRIERGETTLEALATARPDLAAELEALVETAAAVREASASAPDEAFRGQARARLLNRMAARTAVKAGAPEPAVHPTAIPALRRAFTGLAIAVTLLFLGVLAAIPMQVALPGDGLYGGKLALERLQQIAASPAEDAILETRFASNRLTEIQLLIVQGRFDDVDRAVFEYEASIERAVLALNAVARTDGAQTYPILQRIERDLRAYSMTLNELMAFVPGPTQRVLARAIEASQVWSGNSN